MNNQEQPTGEAQSQSVPKPWYKKWWGIVIAILILPIFAIWYIWEKTTWSNKKKGWATVGVIVLSLIVYSEDNKNETTQTSNTPSQSAEQSTDTPPAPPAIPVVFDVPALVGKNIDEVTAILGKPTKDTTKEDEKDALYSLYKTYEKDGLGMLITYDKNTKEVVDFFLDGPDKAKLLAQGNLQEKSDVYVVEPVKVMNDPNQITGIKVMRKLPQELDAEVTFNALAFKVDNKENYDWRNCKFAINGKILSSGYVFQTKETLKAKDSMIIPFSEFTKDSKRFDFTAEKPESLFISCDSLGQHRTNYFTMR